MSRCTGSALSFPIPGPGESGQERTLPSTVAGAGRDEEALLFVGCRFLGWPGRGQDWHVGLYHHLRPEMLCGVSGACPSHPHRAPGPCRNLEPLTRLPCTGRSLGTGSIWGWGTPVSGPPPLAALPGPRGSMCVSPLSSHHLVLQRCQPPGRWGLQPFPRLPPHWTLCCPRAGAETNVGK